MAAEQGPESDEFTAFLADIRGRASTVVGIITAAHRASLMGQLVALGQAIDVSEVGLRRLRGTRDVLIARVAEEGEFGYARIGEAGGVSASYASRVARDAGVRPRHVYTQPVSVSPNGAASPTGD